MSNYKHFSKSFDDLVASLVELSNEQDVSLTEQEKELKQNIKNIIKNNGLYKNDLHVQTLMIGLVNTLEKIIITLATEKQVSV